MKYYIYILYNFVKPCFNVFVYLYFEPESKVLAKINIMLQIILVALLIFIMNYLCASVTAAAHKSQSTLYNTALNKGENIPLRIRTKIMRFIERLSGPEIGFYCFDLFPMTSYNFTDYVFDSIVSYLLILKLLKRSGITIWENNIHLAWFDIIEDFLFRAKILGLNRLTIVKVLKIYISRYNFVIVFIQKYQISLIWFYSIWFKIANSANRYLK